MICSTSRVAASAAWVNNTATVAVLGPGVTCILVGVLVAIGIEVGLGVGEAESGVELGEGWGTVLVASTAPGACVAVLAIGVLLNSKLAFLLETKNKELPNMNATTINKIAPPNAQRQSHFFLRGFSTWSAGLKEDSGYVPVRS